MIAIISLLRAGGTERESEREEEKKRERERERERERGAILKERLASRE